MAKLAWYSTLVTSGLVMLVAACRDATTPETAQRPGESSLAAKKAPPQPPPPPPDVTPPTTPVLSATDAGPTHISLAWKSTDDRATSIVYVIYINGSPNPAGTSSTSQTYYL